MHPVRSKTCLAGIGTLARSKLFSLALFHSWYAKKYNLCMNRESLDRQSRNCATLRICSSTQFFTRNQVAKS